MRGANSLVKLNGGATVPPESDIARDLRCKGHSHTELVYRKQAPV